MKKLSKKSVLLVGAALLVCAFAVPPMASAGSWGAVTSTHVLDSPNLRFDGTMGGNTVGWLCTSSQFHVAVESSPLLTVTRTSFSGCTGAAALAAGCTVTITGTRFPWKVTGTSTTNVQIHNVDIDVRFEVNPSGSSCAAVGTNLTLSGTLNSGSWNPAQHEVTYANATGLSATVGDAITASGTIRDTAQTLTLTD